MSNYTFLDKALHRQFLGPTAISEKLFERLLHKSHNFRLGRKQKNIFITGLARAGTTAFLNKLYASKNFGSFTYKYMPFILSPRIAKIYSKFNKAEDNDLKERFHKDGINIGINSPECLDEIFWIKVKNNNNKFLYPYKPNNNLLDAYAFLIESFSQIEKQERMLIKNNNNHLRIDSLSKYFLNSKFFIIIRNPLYHSQSLLNQHKNFINLQNSDSFILDYMNLIGHNEFGLNAKPFIYNAGDNWFNFKDKLNINYWLEQWIKTHEWILKNNFSSRKNVFIILYEMLCDDNSLFNEICKLIEIKDYDFGTPFFNANKKIDKKLFDKNLFSRANELYEEFEKLAFKSKF